jgi:hypothetical protein
VAIVTLDGGVFRDSSNYDEITNVPQVHTQAKGSYFSRFSRLVDLTCWDSWEWDIAVVELEAGTGGDLADHLNLHSKFLEKTGDNYLLVVVSSSNPSRLFKSRLEGNKKLAYNVVSFPCHSLLGGDNPCNSIKMLKLQMMIRFKEPN